MAVAVIGTCIASAIISIGTLGAVHGMVCAIVQQQITVYRETPPTTSTGVNASAGWNDLHRRLHC